ncbi:hypothetical protein VP01_2g3 [Puccinia sorghi]|uniref:Uncharacterized protein n=1 Tax=Puccinia sorghi TaxID=27349 RepID=A0A0L6V248_9BASI|nr:hypothetical protein VP01_2g3 [Puccinia sorghi]
MSLFKFFLQPKISQNSYQSVAIIFPSHSFQPLAQPKTKEKGRIADSVYVLLWGGTRRNEVNYYTARTWTDLWALLSPLQLFLLYISFAATEICIIYRIAKYRKREKEEQIWERVSPLHFRGERLARVNMIHLCSGLLVPSFTRKRQDFPVEQMRGFHHNLRPTYCSNTSENVSGLHLLRLVVGTFLIFILNRSMTRPFLFFIIQSWDGSAKTRLQTFFKIRIQGKQAHKEILLNRQKKKNVRTLDKCTRKDISLIFNRSSVTDTVGDRGIVSIFPPVISAICRRDDTYICKHGKKIKEYMRDLLPESLQLRVRIDGGVPHAASMLPQSLQLRVRESRKRKRLLGREMRPLFVHVSSYENGSREIRQGPKSVIRGAFGRARLCLGPRALGRIVALQSSAQTGEADKDRVGKKDFCMVGAMNSDIGPRIDNLKLPEVVRRHPEALPVRMVTNLYTPYPLTEAKWVRTGDVDSKWEANKNKLGKNIRVMQSHQMELRTLSLFNFLRTPGAHGHQAPSAVSHRSEVGKNWGGRFLDLPDEGGGEGMTRASAGSGLEGLLVRMVSELDTANPLTEAKSVRREDVNSWISRIMACLQETLGSACWQASTVRKVGPDKRLRLQDVPINGEAWGEIGALIQTVINERWCLRTFIPLGCRASNHGFTMAAKMLRTGSESGMYDLIGIKTMARNQFLCQHPIYRWCETDQDGIKESSASRRDSRSCLSLNSIQQALSATHTWMIQTYWMLQIGLSVGDTDTQRLHQAMAIPTLRSDGEEIAKLQKRGGKAVEHPRHGEENYSGIAAKKPGTGSMEPSMRIGELELVMGGQAHQRSPIYLNSSTKNKTAPSRQPYCVTFRFIDSYLYIYLLCSLLQSTSIHRRTHKVSLHKQKLITSILSRVTLMPIASDHSIRSAQLAQVQSCGALTGGMIVWLQTSVDRQYHCSKYPSDSQTKLTASILSYSGCRVHNSPLLFGPAHLPPSKICALAHHGTCPPVTTRSSKCNLYSLERKLRVVDDSYSLLRRSIHIFIYNLKLGETRKPRIWRGVQSPKGLHRSSCFFSSEAILMQLRNVDCIGYSASFSQDVPTIEERASTSSRRRSLVELSNPSRIISFMPASTCSRVSEIQRLMKLVVFSSRKDYDDGGVTFYFCKKWTQFITGRRKNWTNSCFQSSSEIQWKHYSIVSLLLDGRICACLMNFKLIMIYSSNMIRPQLSNNPQSIFSMVGKRIPIILEQEVFGNGGSLASVIAALDQVLMPQLSKIFTSCVMTFLNSYVLFFIIRPTTFSSFQIDYSLSSHNLLILYIYPGYKPLKSSVLETFNKIPFHTIKIIKLGCSQENKSSRFATPISWLCNPQNSQPIPQMLPERPDEFLPLRAWYTQEAEAIKETEESSFCKQGGSAAETRCGCRGGVQFWGLKRELEEDQADKSDFGGRCGGKPGRLSSQGGCAAGIGNRQDLGVRVRELKGLRRRSCGGEGNFGCVGAESFILFYHKSILKRNMFPGCSSKEWKGSVYWKSEGSSLLVIPVLHIETKDYLISMEKKSQIYNICLGVANPVTAPITTQFQNNYKFCYYITTQNQSSLIKIKQQKYCLLFYFHSFISFLVYLPHKRHRLTEFKSQSFSQMLSSDSKKPLKIHCSYLLFSMILHYTNLIGWIWWRNPPFILKSEGFLLQGSLRDFLLVRFCWRNVSAQHHFSVCTIHVVLELATSPGTCIYSCITFFISKSTLLPEHSTKRILIQSSGSLPLFPLSSFFYFSSSHNYSPLPLFRILNYYFPVLLHPLFNSWLTHKVTQACHVPCSIPIQSILPYPCNCCLSSSCKDCHVHVLICSHLLCAFGIEGNILTNIEIYGSVQGVLGAWTTFIGHKFLG